MASINITFSSGSVDQFAENIYNDLQRFNYFYPPNNSSVKVDGNIAWFKPLGVFGSLSSIINPESVAVRLVNGPAQNQLGAVTLGNHMLVGVRRWRSVVSNRSAKVVSVETEAYEQSNGHGNQFGRWGMGQSKQYEVWRNYLKNIADHWVASSSATESDVATAPAEEVGSDNPWRSQLPPDLR